MGEPKLFASLSSGLLARKGAARPAMRPQGFGQLGATLEDLGWNDMGFEAPKATLTAVRDADHDAFGDSVPQPAIRHPLAGLTPISSPASPVHDQQAELADRFSSQEAVVDEEDDADEEAPSPTLVQLVPPAPAEAQGVPVAAVPEPAAASVKPAAKAPPIARATPGTKAKAAFTLRLDPARHLRLRLACAVTGRSAQLLVTEALDEMIARMPELDGMADRAPRKAN